MKRTMLIAAAIIVLATVVPEKVEAQFYKGKTITMIINYPAGGPTDIAGLSENAAWVDARRQGKTRTPIE